MTPTLHPAGKTHDGHPRYDVLVDGTLVGRIEGHNPTFERSSPGKRYVNARWKSKRRYWRACRVNGSTIAWAVESRKRALRYFEKPVPPEPKRIRLTQDFLDLEVGMSYRAGTELVRMQSGQYALEGTKLVAECVAGLFRIRGIYEVIEP